MSWMMEKIIFFCGKETMEELEAQLISLDA